MNKKAKYELILIILIGVVLINTAIVISHPEKKSDSENCYNMTTVGSNENGTVYKIIAGNNSSNDTVGVILGVHPREHEIHEEVNKTIANITGENGTNNLTKKFVIYYVVTNDNLTSRDDTRPAGENLAHDFIVPNIKADNPFVVIDVHEIDPKYEYFNFIYSISNNSAKTNGYAQIIADNLGIENFNFTEGTSPHKVTEPIAAQGINTLLMETCITNSIQEKHDTAEKLIYTLDNLKK